MARLRLRKRGLGRLSSLDDVLGLVEEVWFVHVYIRYPGNSIKSSFWTAISPVSLLARFIHWWLTNASASDAFSSSSSSVFDGGFVSLRQLVLDAPWTRVRSTTTHDARMQEV